MSTETAVFKQHSSSYDIFILVLTIMSLAVMVLLLLPLRPADARSPALLRQRGLHRLPGRLLRQLRWRATQERLPRRPAWLARPPGLHPELRAHPGVGLLRLFRLSRLARVSRMLRGQARERLIKDVVDNRGQYATFITILAAFIVLSVSTVLVLQFESKSPDSNITTGGDALWWGLVTITTVGYGDYYPVTALGRMTGVFVMFAGVGIIGSLASILASVLVPPPKDKEQAAAESRGAPPPRATLSHRSSPTSGRSSPPCASPSPTGRLPRRTEMFVSDDVSSSLREG